MFADDIINSRVLRDIELGAAGHDRLSLLLKHAQKFVLAPDFVSAADALYTDKNQLDKALEFCELPFPLCWFEFSNQRRERWVSGAEPDALSPVAVPQSDIERVGYLFQEVKGEATWMISMFWKIRGLDTASFTPYTVSLTAEQRTRAYLTQPGNKVSNSIMEWAEHFVNVNVYAINKNLARTFHASWQNDWNGELPFIFAMLGILNARNISEHEYADRTELNKKRARRGKLPLSSHHTLTINPRVRRFFRSSGKGEVADLRAHFVRGHFKVRKSGVFFWLPHLRRDKGNGFVCKDYKAV